MATLEFDKIDATCGNVYLIDENLCLSNSYPIINKNFSSLSASLVNLNRYGNEFNILFSNFAANSSRWITSINNWETLSAKLISAETTVKNLSSNWQKNSTLIYNELIDLPTYYSNEVFYKNIIKDWITLNLFDYFPNDQIIDVDVYLTYEQPFTWSYFREYYENCVPPNTSSSGRCSYGTLRSQCNELVIDGRLIAKGCMNVGPYCTPRSTVIVGINTIKCPNNGASTVSFSENFSSTDKSIARVIRVQYIKRKTSIDLYP
jgi:hypothetical protein